jgi:hypothetical protein
MTFQTVRNLLTGVAVVVSCAALPASASASAGDACFHGGRTYSDGAASCQSGFEYRCNDGEWIALRTSCRATAPEPSRSCRFADISYSTGSASCQAGTQFRCEDGEWRSLGVSCANESEIKALPGGRTCMFGGATVSTNSTICQSGTTFLCTDGEWLNLGTQCR